MARTPWIIPAALTLFSGLLCAQVEPADTGTNQEPNRPSAAQRVVRVFDFEESGYNPLPVPLGWIRAQHDPQVPRDRPGFPIWNQAELDRRAPAASGQMTVRMPVEGGSTSLRLLPGVVGVFAGADYLVTARVRTEDIRHARALLIARLLDGDGVAIPGMEARSEAVRAPEEWRVISATLPGLSDRAVFLEVELLVVQPESMPDADAARPFAVWEQDFNGSAWFDDVVIAQLPRLELETGYAGQVIPANEKPRLRTLIRDLTGDALGASIRVFDSSGTEVARKDIRPGAGRLEDEFVPTLPGAGWYRAVLEVVAGGLRVGVAVVDFAWGDQRDTRAGDGVFSIRAQATRPEEADALPLIVDWTGVRHATVGVWEESQKIEDTDPSVNPAFGAIRELLDRQVTTTVLLGESPRELAVQMGRDVWDVPGILSMDETLWMPWTERALDRYGQSVLSWQLGRDGTGVPAGVLSAEVEAAASVIGRWVPGPEIRVPWGALDGLPEDLIQPGRGLVITDEGLGSDETIGALVRTWAAQSEVVGASGADAPTLTIEFHSDRVGRSNREALARTARRAIEGWWAARAAGTGSVRLALAEPWRAIEGRRRKIVPTPELAMWRTLGSVLGGRTPTAELDLLPGVRALLTGSADDGMLVVWLTDPAAPVREIDLPLAMGPVRVVDILGARRDIEPEIRSSGRAPSHRIEITREPVIIEGVRVDLVRFLASLEFSPNKLEAVRGIRTHELAMNNPWPFPIRGRIYVIEPGGFSQDGAKVDRSWQIQPRVIPFDLASGETRTVPISIAFGAAEEAGPKRLVFDVELTADEEYARLRIEDRINLGSDTMGVEVVAHRRASGGITLHAMVTNTTAERQSLELAAIAPGIARQRASINSILPGETVERRFVLDSVPSGQRISVSVSNTASGVRVTKSAPVP